MVSYLLLQRLSLSGIHLLSFIFLILVIIGNINAKAVIRSTYFLKIDLSNVIPRSAPNAVLINSIARSIGLHDFYQVGLWNYCAGYLDTGITYCSEADSWYWFNPAEVLVDELLAGATIALPAKLSNILDLIRIVSHWMFGLFISGAVFNFLCIFLASFSVSSKARTYKRGSQIFLRRGPLVALSFLAMLCTTGGSIVATVMFTIFKNVMTSREELNIDGEVGTSMLAYMWTATGLAIVGFMWQAIACCCVCCLCCTSREKEKKIDQDVEKEEVANGTTSRKRTGIQRRIRWLNMKGKHR